jgi:hypothetical protein
LLLNFEDYVTDREEGLGKARGSVERWFDDAMDRVSGAYKRYSQNLALLIGLLIALFLNVDSINLTLYLWREPSVRQVLVNQASKFELDSEELKTNPEAEVRRLREQFIGLNLPIGWGITNVQSLAVSHPSCRLFPGANQAFGIPIVGSTRCIVPPQSNNQMNLVLKLGGIFLTALAARQGAPFWFDILKRAVNLRSTGANPVEKEGK